MGSRLYTPCITYFNSAFPEKSLVGQLLSRKVCIPTDQLKERALSDPGCQFIQELLSPQPSDRPTAMEALQKAWIAGVWNSVEKGKIRLESMKSQEASENTIALALAPVPSVPVRIVEQALLGPPTDSGYASLQMSSYSKNRDLDEDTSSIYTDNESLALESETKENLILAFADEMCQSLRGNVDLASN